MGKTETVTVSLSQPGNGTLLNLGGGTYDPVHGVYTISSTPAQVTAALQGLVFQPTAHQVAAGESVTTVLTIAVDDGHGGHTADSTTSVTTTATGDLNAVSSSSTSQAASTVSSTTNLVAGSAAAGAAATVASSSVQSEASSTTGSRSAPSTTMDQGISAANGQATTPSHGAAATTTSAALGATVGNAASVPPSATPPDYSTSSVQTTSTAVIGGQDTSTASTHTAGSAQGNVPAASNTPGETAAGNGAVLPLPELSGHPANSAESASTGTVPAAASQPPGTQAYVPAQNNPILTTSTSIGATATNAAATVALPLSMMPPAQVVNSVPTTTPRPSNTAILAAPTQDNGTPVGSTPTSSVASPTNSINPPTSSGPAGNSLPGGAKQVGAPAASLPASSPNAQVAGGVALSSTPAIGGTTNALGGSASSPAMGLSQATTPTEHTLSATLTVGASASPTASTAQVVDARSGVAGQGTIGQAAAILPPSGTAAPPAGPVAPAAAVIDGHLRLVASNANISAAPQSQVDLHHQHTQDALQAIGSQQAGASTISAVRNLLGPGNIEYKLPPVPTYKMPDAALTNEQMHLRSLVLGTHWHSDNASTHASDAWHELQTNHSNESHTLAQAHHEETGVWHQSHHDASNMNDHHADGHSLHGDISIHSN